MKQFNRNVELLMYKLTTNLHESSVFIGAYPGCGAGSAWETGASRNASLTQEADWSVPDDEKQPLSCELSVNDKHLVFNS